MTGPTEAAGPATGSATGWVPGAGATPVVVTGVTAAPTTPVVVVEPADLVAAAVLAVPGVAGLHPGRFGEVATYLPGRRVTGVKLGTDVVEVHVVATSASPLLAVAQQIHAAVSAVVDAPVQVFVEDLADHHAA